MTRKPENQNILPISDVQAGRRVWQHRGPGTDKRHGEPIQTCDPFTWNGGAYGHFVSDGAPITNPDFAVIAYERDRY